MARSLNSQSGRDDEPVDDNSRLRALNLGARAGRYCHGYKAQRGDEARHYDRAHALHRAIENRTLDTETALEPSTNAGHHDETVQDSNTAQADESTLQRRRTEAHAGPWRTPRLRAQQAPRYTP